MAKEAWYMALVVEQPIETFDLSEIARGDLVYGKHRTWPEGKQQSGKCHCRDRQSLSEVHGKKFIFITGGKET